MCAFLSSLSKCEDGFSLLEMAIVLIIMGLVGGASLHVVTALTQRQARLKTKEHQEYALQAIAAFVEHHHRFPCPADPKLTGLEAGLEPRERKCSGAKAEGILPFRTLGISAQFARDGFKHWMTYVVEPNLADKDHVHRIKSISGRQITVHTEDSLPVFVDHSVLNPNFIALVLISHGEGGEGAFRGAGSTGRIPLSSASAYKRENMDGNFIFMDAPQSGDILRWESRDHFFKQYVRDETF